MPFFGVVGFFLLCVGGAGLFNGKLGSSPVSKKTAWLMTGGGIALLVGAMIGEGYSAPFASVSAFLAWASFVAAWFLLVTGSLGPLTGRLKSLIFFGASLVLLVVAVGVQGTADQTAKVKAEQDKAAALEQKYQDAVAMTMQAKWEEAIAAFAGIPDYKDSGTLLVDARYEQAAKLVQEQAWDKAIAALTQMPQTYKDVPTLLTQARDGQSATLFKGALSLKAEKKYREAEGMLSEAIQIGGKVPGDVEAELKAVTALREQTEREEAERVAQQRARQQKIDSEAGPKPENSAWDAAVAPVVAFLKANLKDPKSVEYVEWSPVTLMELDQFYWAVRVKYRAKNSFGGYVLEQKLFLMQHGKVVDYSSI